MISYNKTMTKYYCQFCNKTFNQKPNKFRHQKHCFDNPDRIDIRCDRCNKQFSYPSSLKTHLKKSCRFKDKVKLSLRKRGESPIFKPDINVVDDTILERLKLYIGDDDGIDFLINSIHKNQYHLIIKESYFHNLSSLEYPMTKDSYGKFRYLNDRKELINDIDGTGLAQVLTTYIQNALLKACNQLIAKYIALGEMDPLYDKYKIHKLQKIAFNLTTNTREVTKFLTGSELLSPTHCFWQVKN